MRIIAHWAQSLAGKVPRNDPDARMGWLIIIGTIPIVILGYLFQDVDPRTRSATCGSSPSCMIVFGLLLGTADRSGKRTRELDQTHLPARPLLGFAQALALIPGVSRSGATTTLGLALGYTRPAAARVRVPARRARGLRQRSVRARARASSEPGGPYSPRRDRCRRRSSRSPWASA